MEELKNYIIKGLEADNTLSALVALVMALIENSNKGNSIKHLIVISACSFGLAGTLIDFIPNPSMFMVVLVGILSGTLTDDLYGRIIQRFPTLLEEIMNTGLEKIKEKIKGKKENE